MVLFIISAMGLCVLIETKNVTFLPHSHKYQNSHFILFNYASKVSFILYFIL